METTGRWSNEHVCEVLDTLRGRGYLNLECRLLRSHFNTQRQKRKHHLLCFPANLMPSLSFSRHKPLMANETLMANEVQMACIT